MSIIFSHKRAPQNNNVSKKYNMKPFVFFYHIRSSDQKFQYDLIASNGEILRIRPDERINMKLERIFAIQLRAEKK